ncbi:MAG: acetyl-CoA carboxylase biotin carboxyl carrier protein subunit [Gemmatimonadota bacterium]|nr:acetyl-CoA carboxylase biotin carboxyl carrier protein subunit [Gemmatimonadota bacterium]
MNNHVRYHVTVGAVTLDVEIDAEGVLIDGDRILATGPELAGSNVYSFLVDGASHTVLAERGASGVWDLQLRGQRHRVEVMDERTKVLRNMNSAAPDLQGPLPVRAPMPGLVVKVEVQEGDLVEAGRGLLVVEAMKMENSLTAPVGGRIGAIHVVAGQTVEKDEILIDLVPPDQESD